MRSPSSHGAASRLTRRLHRLVVLPVLLATAAAPPLHAAFMLEPDGMPVVDVAVQQANAAALLYRSRRALALERFLICLARGGVVTGVQI